MNYGFSHMMISNANDMSLGVKVSANGKTAFLAGDINNTLGAENTLAGQLGHVDLLCMEMCIRDSYKSKNNKRNDQTYICKEIRKE